MSTTTTGTGGAAAREMPLIHRIFRREFALLREIVREQLTDAARVRAVAEHLIFSLDGLHHHHTTEDDLIWPLLRERVGMDASLVARMEDQHHAIARAIGDVRAATAAWATTPSEENAAALAATLGRFLDVMGPHLDEEERDVVPLIDRHLTSAEWEDLGRQAFAKFTPVQRWIATGQLLDVATPEEAQMMLGKFPLPVRGLWHLIGRRTYRRYIEHVRGGDHR